MLAAMAGRVAVYQLLLHYRASEEVRDYSGRTASQYLLPSVDPAPASQAAQQKERTRVGRSATQHFMRELRDSFRSNLLYRPKSIGE